MTKKCKTELKCGSHQENEDENHSEKPLPPPQNGSSQKPPSTPSSREDTKQLELSIWFIMLNLSTRPCTQLFYSQKYLSHQSSCPTRQVWEYTHQHSSQWPQTKNHPKVCYQQSEQISRPTFLKNGISSHKGHGWAAVTHKNTDEFS